MLSPKHDNTVVLGENVASIGAGTYSVTVSDGYECFLSSVDIVIAEPTDIDASLVTATSQSCLSE